MTQKRSAKDRTAAEWKSVAKATRRRRRILQAGFFFTFYFTGFWFTVSIHKSDFML